MERRPATQPSNPSSSRNKASQEPPAPTAGRFPSMHKSKQQSTRFFPNDLQDYESISTKTSSAQDENLNERLLVEELSMLKLIASSPKETESLLFNYSLEPPSGVRPLQLYDGPYVYVGMGGLALIINEVSNELLCRYGWDVGLAYEICNECIIYSKKLHKSRYTFLEGESGILAIMCVILARNGAQEEEIDKRLEELLSLTIDVLHAPSGDCELLYGRCGIIYSLLFSRKVWHGKIRWQEGYLKILQALVVQVIEEGFLQGQNRSRENENLYSHIHSYLKQYTSDLHLQQQARAISSNLLDQQLIELLDGLLVAHALPDSHAIPASQAIAASQALPSSPHHHHLSSQRNTSSSHSGHNSNYKPFPGMRFNTPLKYQWHQTAYLGGAHGTAGILYILIQAVEVLLNYCSPSRHFGGSEDSRYQNFAKDSQRCWEDSLNLLLFNVRYFLQVGRSAGGVNMLSSLPAGKDNLIHWCHGAPGWIPLLLKGANIAKQRAHDDLLEPSSDTLTATREELFSNSSQANRSPKPASDKNSFFEVDSSLYDTFMEAALSMGELVWEKGLLKKGSGVCHGISGNGMALLSLYRATHNLKWLHRAQKFALFALERLEELLWVPDRPFSLFEGIGGLTLFIHNVRFAESSYFVGYEVAS